MSAEFENQLLSVLGRIATALEEQVRTEVLSRKRAEAGKKGAAVVARGEQGRFTPANTGKITVPPNATQALIGAYIRNWQQRYATKARPAVTKAIGVFKALLKERSPGEIAELLQVYCQMEDSWFDTKKHDVVTFGENIGKIALARDKGHERPNGEKHWTEIYQERKTEIDGATVRDADKSTQLTVAEDLWRRT